MTQTSSPTVAMLDPQDLIEAFHSTPSPDAAQQALEPTSHIKRFALGRNEHTQKLLETVRLDGIVDDFAAPGTRWNGLDIVKGEELPAGSVLINCSMSISPLSAGRRIAELKNVSAISYADLYRDLSSPVAVPDFVTEARFDLAAKLSRYATVFERLADRESKEVFNKLVAYRLTADPIHMEGFSVRLRDQYFEPFLGSLDKTAFVDCGGYDGDTTEIFAARYPAYAKIHFFEPSSANMQRARARLAGVRDIEFIPLGVSNSAATLRFDAEAGSASSVSDSGSISIEVTTLDRHIPTPVDFIKMDLEGWELNALRGAQDHVRRDAPILAIAVYHRISDFVDIPEYVLSLQPDYDIYLRHYTEGWSETVMYFVPRHSR